MSIILGRGDIAKKMMERGADNKIDFKKAFFRLKPGENRKVRIVSSQDFVVYKAHTHFNKGIFTQPCISPAEERCLFCEASNFKEKESVEGDKEWESLWARKRVLFAFVDLEEDLIRVFDATKNQAETLMAAIEEYVDDLDEVAFTFKRIGEKNDTSYSLSPILKLKAELKDIFVKWEGQTIETTLFEQLLQPRTTEQQAMELQKAGFPIDQLGFVGERDI